ncbi:conserved exported protein of unknown function [Tepidanaerobacter acetatoxydans Re1]|uniref:Uncharacterized protein n=1 Tax=Tepidanaerobacter acetatoxydans (strain DSM 21804 / JCM 16047 / Re1) TaxID=1209989 RepID=L0S0H9_TEPAE|nr:conserved exported protein of unknown function [Tepidanaerobacter acetatoxydans Re1]
MEMMQMRLCINRCIVLAVTFLVLMNFYLAPKSVVAYNTKNLTTMNIMAKQDITKSVSKN